MTDASTGQLLKALALLLAGGGFAWWQLRDISRAQRESREQHSRELQEGRKAAVAADEGKPPPQP
jgi:hypothetical protein